MPTNKRKSIKLNKANDEWVVAIYCDYGDKEVKRQIRASYSLESGKKAWQKFSKMFSKNKYRCWQEDKKGNIINDSANKIG